jgi:hypothetical protein
LYRNALVTCLISERYQNVPIVDALDCAVEVRRNFDCAGLKQGGASLARYPQLRAGLRQVAELFGDDVSCRMEESVRQYLADGVYHTGLCHGDFHFRNIMRDNKGHVRVIDLDCVRFEGVVELDAVYFALEMEWSASGDLWLETLATAFEHGGDNIAQWLGRFSVCWNEALGLVYFLDRVGQENINYGFKYSKMKMERAVAAMQRADHGMIDREQV